MWAPPQVYVAEAGRMLSLAGVPDHAIITQLAGAEPRFAVVPWHGPAVSQLLHRKLEASRKQTLCHEQSLSCQAGWRVEIASHCATVQAHRACCVALEA